MFATRLARAMFATRLARALFGTRLARVAAFAAVVLAAAGCTSVSLDVPYYWQAARGQIELLRLARPIDDVLADAATDERLRARLERVREIRAFASRELGLPANGSYTRYADLGRPFVVWNVFATPELSLELKQWCFPVAGCVAYRGYFSQDAAQRYASELRAAGWEAYVAGVPAYSTLGWFDDPVLNTFIGYPEGELARLVFHELAHQLVYAKGDTQFNESFATAVEEAGVERWLVRRADPAVTAAYREFDDRRRQFVALLRRHRDALKAVYDAAGDDDARRAGKRAQFAALRDDYRALRQSWGGFAGYDRWFAQELTNAQLSAIGAYAQWVPAFRALLAAGDGNLERFYAAVRALAATSRRDRDARLGELERSAPGR